MALVVGSLDSQIPAVPPVSTLLPATRRRRSDLLRPCGTSAARRRHFLRREPQDDACREWHRKDMAKRRAAKRSSRHRNLWHTPIVLTAGSPDLYGTELVA